MNKAIKSCEYREEACCWHRKCHCLHGIERYQVYPGTENMPFCYKLIKAKKCPLKRKN